MSQAQYETLIGKFCRSIGIEDMERSETGEYAFSHPSSVTVEVAYDHLTEHVVVSCDLGFIADELVADWYPRLLEANTFWAGTGGATLGVYKQQVILAYQQPLENLNPESLQILFDSFAEAASHWRQQLQTGPQIKEEVSANEMMQMMQLRV